MGFAGYFLIVSDFIRAGREIGVFVGPGRGSAAGSVVAYCIGITNIDPIKYNLLFERFLNPERKSMPDIDTDFDDEGRQKVIDYVVQKYGKNQVALIITYGTMAAKSSIADVSRVMDLPLSESRILTKLIPEKPGITLKRLLHAPMTIKDVVKEKEKSLEEKEKRKKLVNLIIVAEGDEFGGANELSTYIKSKLPSLEVRVCILGHIQRGGSPTCMDRLIASRMGYHAVECLIEGRHNLFVGILNNKMHYTPLDEAVKKKQRINEEWMKIVKILAS
jgi:hypothetical protein